MSLDTFWFIGKVDSPKKRLSRYLREAAHAEFFRQEKVCRLLRASAQAFKENYAGLNFLH